MVSKKSNKKTRPEVEVPPSAGAQAAGVKGIADIAKRFGLTDKQAQFVINYWTGGLNARRAAVAAGYSPKSIGSQAYQLLHNPKIARAIAAVAEAQGIRTDILQARLIEMALEADVAHYAGFLRGEEDLDELAARGVNTKLIKSGKTRQWTRVTREGDTITSITREVTLHDPLRAISLLLPSLDASKEVKSLERGPEWDYTVGQMLTREFLEQVPRHVLEGIPGLRLLPASDGK